MMQGDGLPDVSIANPAGVSNVAPKAGPLSPE